MAFNSDVQEDEGIEMKETIQKKGFSFGWTPLDMKATIQPDGYYTMRDWQELAYNQLLDKDFWLINAPMASGKTFEIGCLTASKLMQNKKLRAIIAVPQTLIGFGFLEMRIEYPNGEKFDFFPRHNLCKDTPQSNIEYVLKWLKGPNSEKDVLDRILICSHATLVYSFQTNPDLFKDVFIVVDEAHHIFWSENEELKIEFSNAIGNVIQYCLKNKKRNVHLGLTTATFFRGDRGEIIPKKYIGQFARFNLPYDEFLQSMRHMKSFSYDFFLCNNKFTEAVKHLFDDGVEKTIVYVPPVGSRFSTGDKHNDVLEIYKSIALSDKPQIVEQEDGITLIKRGKQFVRVVNLVDEDNRENKKKAIQAAHEQGDDSGIDVIIALGMFKEGGNWKWADREIILGPRKSLTDIIQIIGRLFRDANGKEHVSVFHLLPFALDQVDKEKTRENLNDFLKAIFASMLLEEIFRPVSIYFPTSKKDIADEPGEGQERTNYLQEVCEDEQEVASILDEIQTEIVAILDANKELQGNNKKLFDVFQEIVAKVLTENEKEEYHKEIAGQIWKMWQRRTAQAMGLDIHNVDFDIINNINPLEFLIAYTSDTCNVKTFRDFRQAIRFYCFLPYEELKALMHRMRAEGTPINSQIEYGIWRKNGCNYDAVLNHRRKVEK